MSDERLLLLPPMPPLNAPLLWDLGRASGVPWLVGLWALRG